MLTKLFLPAGISNLKGAFSKYLSFDLWDHLTCIEMNRRKTYCWAQRNKLWRRILVQRKVVYTELLRILFLELRGHHVLNNKIFGVNFPFRQLVSCYSGDRDTVVLGDPEVTANLYCAFAYLYWEGCVICSIYLQYNLTLIVLVLSLLI